MRPEALLKAMMWGRLCLDQTEKPFGGQPPWVLRTIASEALALSKAAEGCLARWIEAAEEVQGCSEVEDQSR